MKHLHHLLLVPAAWAITSQAQLVPPAVPMSTGFNSSFALSAVQIEAAELSETAASSINAVINFYRSSLANGGPRQDDFYSLPEKDPALEAGQVLKVQEVTDPAPFAIASGSSLSRILYTTRNLNGTIVPASAYILWPFLPRQFHDKPDGNDDKAAAILWAHGTTGYFADSAPSSFRTLYYENMVPLSLVQAGYAVVAPDYAGLGLEHDWDGNTIPHQYFATPAGGQDTLYAMQAALEAFDERLSGKFAIAGHSQGGGVAWSAAELLASNDKQNDFKKLLKGYVGTISVAPVTKVFSRLGFLAITVSIRLSSIFPDFDLNQWLHSLAIARARLLGQIQGSAAVAQQLFLAEPSETFLKPGWYDSSYHARAFAKLGNVGGRPFAGPMLVIQGSEDVFIEDSVTNQTIKETCDLQPESDLEYMHVKGLGHTPVISAARLLWMNWLEERFSGGKTKAGCKETSISGWLGDGITTSSNMADTGERECGSTSADPDAVSLAHNSDIMPGARTAIDALTVSNNDYQFTDFGSIPQSNNLGQHGLFDARIEDLWSASLANTPNNIAATSDQPTYMDSNWNSRNYNSFTVSTGDLALGESDVFMNGYADAINKDNVLPTADSGSSTAATDDATSSRNLSLPPKIGHRFTRDSARVLKWWFAEHTEHPYPSEEERIMLQCKTGLTKTQVTNWLANARRRRTADCNAHSSLSRAGKSQSGSAHTPRRAGTPIPRSTASYQNMDPLQRWVDSPPENEPAAASAIARAVASGDIMPSLSRRYTGSSDDGSGRIRRHASSASSFATSSRGSTDSRSSKGSISASSSLSRGRSYRRRRAAKTTLATPRHAFQCTFCTETFRTKYDWQRHENSLHLPLERWVCSPDGASAVNPETNQKYCVFCGEPDPSEAHLATHNPAACQERSFSRKDHLKQHLRLVHHAGLISLSMKLWKAEKPEIHSRCGFCQADLETWPDRVDHLANHFKLGSTMADWSGDWGFEESINVTLENSMPPYLIDFERGTPFPFEASGKPPDSPRSAYELITLELAYFIQTHYDAAGDMPNNLRLQLEACRIIFASEVVFPEQNSDSHGGLSWLRDLILSSSEITQQARFGPIRSRAESRLSTMKIKGKNALFEACPLESHLHAFVHARRATGAVAVQDHELQKDACRIITRMEGDLGTTPDFVANWLVTLISQSTDWLRGFRRRANLLTWDMPIQNIQNPMPSWFEGQNERPLQNSFPDDLFPLEFRDTSLGEASGTGLDIGQCYSAEPSNGQAHSSGLIPPWLINNPDMTISTTSHPHPNPPSNMEGVTAGNWPASAQGESPNTQGTQPSEGDMNRRPAWLKTGIFILNDSNHHRWLAHELKRWVTATMSPNNPNRHVPSDEELRHQARCLLYNDDDPWNQSAADNAQWLDKFKLDVGIQ
ncbi:hypothetical protein FZEAL_3593 [Fusarium zealandicum]|uniref:Uncharacterized protein n=1 Tax=Fusarium zealandicum TaxID=1053134 RepID=A0A8H4UP77_9HYPO|nr:hypothetical protein FZEAL_3593 [Fusarium zealandicum]